MLVYSTWYIDIRILQSMISGISLILCLGTRMADPYVAVVFWVPSSRLRRRLPFKGTVVTRQRMHIMKVAVGLIVDCLTLGSHPSPVDRSFYS